MTRLFLQNFLLFHCCESKAVVYIIGYIAAVNNASTCIYKFVIIFPIQNFESCVHSNFQLPGLLLKEPESLAACGEFPEPSIMFL